MTMVSSPTRRSFLKSAGAAVVLAAATPLWLKSASRLLPDDVVAASGPAASAERWRPTSCWIGKQDCGMLARIVDGRVVKLEGHPDHPRNRGTLCVKGLSQILSLYDPYRVKAPLLRTNEKGVPGQWREISWDEALKLVADQINEIRARDPKLILWQKGRSKQEAIYDRAFVSTIGATKVGHGASCSDAGYRAAEYTIGPHGNAHPDFRYTRYLLSWGWNATNAGGNKLCWITWNRQFLEAREKGMKVVSIDPYLRGSGPYADMWLPIKPGTDLALALAFCHILIKEGFLDRPYLQSHTNAPFLLDEDGSFLRVNGKEQVWDEATASAQPYDGNGVQPALEGAYTVAGRYVKPVFQAFKEHVERYTPEWAAEICGIPAGDIRRVAQDLGENARIGSTITVEGLTLPYRPVSIMAYHVSQQEMGFQFYRAMYMIMMLLGAVEAVGGLRIDFIWNVHDNYKALETVKIKDPPYDFTLKDSKFFPINTVNPGMIAKVMLNPQRYEVNKVPEMAILHMYNAAVSQTDQATIEDAYKKFKFVVVIDPWLSRTADLFADVVLPAATLEKYEGPLNGSDTYTDAVAFRLPVMEPIFQSRSEVDIYMDLCEKAGLLFGKGGFLDHLNDALGLKEPNNLDLNRKPTVRQIFDNWAKAQGLTEGIAYFESKGVWLKGPVPAKKYYGFAQSPPFNGIRHRFYGEGLLRYQREMRARGVDELYWHDYTPFPTWRNPVMWQSPPQYDLTLISLKKIEFKQSRASQVALLAELAPEQRLAMNPSTARARNIQDGDEVTVESHNAVTGETRKVKARVMLTEAIRPDVVALPHHYGEVANHPWAKGQGPTPNVLFFTGEGYVTNTADNSFHVRVRVYKT